MELSLNHYQIALHNLPPLEVQEEKPEPGYNFKERTQLMTKKIQK